MPQEHPLVSPKDALNAGILPIKNSPVRCAVGDPNGISSNAWRVWVQGAGDIYVACRDNFKELKVSLHISGRWRFGFTSEAADKRPDLVEEGGDRAWEVWDKPGEIAPGVVRAYKMLFPRSELALSPENRKPKDWKNVVFIEAGDDSHHTALILYVCRSDVQIDLVRHQAFCLGVWSLPNEQVAVLYAEVDSTINVSALIDASVAQGAAQAEADGVEVPPTACFLFHGHEQNGTRFSVIAQNRPPQMTKSLI